MSWHDTRQTPSAGLSVGLGVRPPRVAIGVPSIKGLSWPRVFETAIAAQARTWGGIANLPFPLTPGFTNSDLFWVLADRFDADAWATYVVTVADMEQLDNKWFEQREAQLRQQLKGDDPSVVDQFLRDHRESHVTEGFQPEKRQWDDLVTRLAPFHRGGAEPLDWATSSAPQWPFVDVASFRELPKVVKNVTTSLGPVLQLLLTTEVGRLVPSFAAALAAKGVSVADEALGSGTSRAIFDRGSSEAQAYPWTLSEHGLAHYRGGALPRPPAVLVVGGSAWDFTLFYALRRWTSVAFWFPTWLRGNSLFVHYLLSAVHRWANRNASGIAVVTTSTDMTFRDEVARLVGDHQSSRGDVSTASWAEVIPDEPNRLFERGNFGVPRQLVPMEGEITTELPTPQPRRVTCDDPYEMRWLTEIDVVDWSPLRHPAVGPSVLRAHGPEFQRPTRAGAAYFCPSTFFPAGEELETITIRPRLSPLSLLHQIRAIVEPQGWRCDLSDKGIYAAETTTLFGGREELCTALRRLPLRRLLDGYVVGGAGIHVAGDRRCLSARHIADLVGAEADELIDMLVGREVLTRGLVLKCGRCRRSAWYSLEDVGQRFRCARCRLEQRVDRRWVGDDEPAWFYELAEVVHQFIEHDGDIPVLAADLLLADTRRDVQRTVELEFFPPGFDDLPPSKRKTVEIDIVASDGHRLWLGEAATDLRPDSQRLRTLRRIADGTSAHGMLFATARASFTTSVVGRINQAFKRREPVVTFIADVRTRTGQGGDR